MSDWLEKGIEELRLEEKSLSYLARESAREDNPYAEAVRAEIIRRTTEAQICAAKWMRWSVIAIAITSGLTAIVSVLGWLFPHPFGP